MDENPYIVKWCKCDLCGKEMRMGFKKDEERRVTYCRICDEVTIWMVTE